jgi:hypothetical protein
MIEEAERALWTFKRHWRNQEGRQEVQRYPRKQSNAAGGISGIVAAKE